MTRRTAVDLGALLLAAGLIAISLPVVGDLARWVSSWHYRRVLLAELRPVRLANCTLERFGSVNDGGYLMCGNLLTAVSGAYSYGIEGRDEWGCAVAERIAVPVHQYDCFVTTRPKCAGGTFNFHEECVGDAGKQLVVKMDVEGAEWESLAKAPDEVLFVNRALARYDDVEAVPRLPSLLDSPNNSKLPDCQSNW